MQLQLLPSVCLAPPLPVLQPPCALPFPWPAGITAGGKQLEHLCDLLPWLGLRMLQDPQKIQKTPSSSAFRRSFSALSRWLFSMFSFQWQSAYTNCSTGLAPVLHLLLLMGLISGISLLHEPHTYLYRTMPFFEIQTRNG